MNCRKLLLGLTLLLLAACSATRYVPEGKYLLHKNVIEGVDGKKTFSKDPAISEDILANYIGHKPNKSTLGVRFSLGFYNMVDSSKHSWWHKLWSEKLGTPPVILDTIQVKETSRKMKLHLNSSGYLNASVDDSISHNKKRKATAHYLVDPRSPYTISELEFNIEDKFIRELIMYDTTETLIKLNNNFDINMLQRERERIARQLQEMGLYSFRSSAVSYLVDSSHNNNTVSIELNLKKKRVGYNEAGDPILTNHPIHRISRIVINTDYTDPSRTAGQENKKIYDTLEHKGIYIVYSGKLNMKPDVIFSALTFAPNAPYDPTAIDKTNANIRELGYTTSLQFNPIEVAPADVIIVTPPSATTDDASTIEQQMEFVILCTPHKKHSTTQNIELSFTSAYFSTALTLGYQNRNLLRGAELFDISIRGVYEFMRDRGSKNSFEIGGIASLSIPRFTPAFGLFRSTKISQRQTNLQLNYNIQERPFYRRSVFGGVFGYSFLTGRKSRIIINPVDISIIDVPRIDEDYLNPIHNKYLRNSYESQVIAGLSLGYFHNSNPNHRESGYTIRVMMDTNGNLISLFNGMLSKKTTEDGIKYHTIGGQRYAQYSRASFEYAARRSFGSTFQLAWRFFAGGAIPYGNSTAVPFDRQFYAGGSNSMRGWQIRTLGLGGELQEQYIDSTSGRKPFILGDFKLEGNVEMRFNIYNWLNVATFVDVGNIWMNSKARNSDKEMFKFKSFGNQLAVNTGLGLRLDFNFFLVRLDWGIKLRSPNRPQGERWFKEMKLSDNVFHFAVGLPF